MSEEERPYTTVAPNKKKKTKGKGNEEAPKGAGKKEEAPEGKNRSGQDNAPAPSTK